METRVQYAHTTDGVDIAFAVHGDGLPIVVAPNLANMHLQLETEERAAALSFLTRLAKRLKVIRYDSRGGGMSQRDALDFSTAAAGLDLAAVADRAGLDRFALYTHTLAGEGPFAYAANNPDRVSCIICWIGQTVRVLPEVIRRIESIAHLQTEDWELYCNITSRLMFGWDSPESAPFAVMLRAGSSAEARPLALAAAAATFRGEWAGRVRVPTLLCYISGADAPTRIARRLAASIPGAQIVSIPGSANGYPTGLPPAVWFDSEIFAAAIADFVGSTWADPAAPIRAPELQLGAMRAILFTDIVGHTEMMQRLGDAKGREVLREHEAIVRDLLTLHGGTEVKTIGDAFMAWFSSAQQATECAIALQRTFAAHNDSAGEPLLLRTGINAGEPIFEDDDLFGSSVIAASRICHEARGGEIVASDVVRQLVAGKGFQFAERGDVLLKGFDEPLRLYEVRWRE